MKWVGVVFLLCCWAELNTACIRGAELIPPEAAPGVEAMLKDGALVQAFEEGDAPYYSSDQVVTIPHWSTGTERAFLTLHEVAHGWQNRTGYGGTHWLSMTPEGIAAAELGMDEEDAADVIALHYLGLTEIPVPASRRLPGYLTGAVPDAWLAWAREWVP